MKQICQVTRSNNGVPEGAVIMPVLDTPQTGSMCMILSLPESCPIIDGWHPIGSTVAYYTEYVKPISRAERLVAISQCMGTLHTLNVSLQSKAETLRNFATDADELMFLLIDNDTSDVALKAALDKYIKIQQEFDLYVEN